MSRGERRLVVAAYTMAVFLAFVPLGDAWLLLAPLRITDPVWRYGAVGRVARLIAIPLVGMGLALAMALTLRHRLVLRVLAVASGLGASLTFVVAALFTLDAMSLRQVLNPDLRLSFDFGALTALVRLGVTVVIASAVAWGAWRASRTMAPSAGVADTRRSRPQSSRTGRVRLAIESADGGSS